MGDEVQYRAKTWAESAQQSASKTQTQSTTRKVLDEELLYKILSGLGQTMTDKEIESYAKALLEPQLNAELEAAENTYETTRSSKAQESEALAQALQRSVAQQTSAYRQSMADVEKAALARGMGRSSYTLGMLANKGTQLAEAVRSLTDEEGKKQRLLGEQVAQAERQRTQTVNRLNKDYATGVAAKVQELRQAQQDRWNNQYMSAVSAALGSQTSGSSTSNTMGSTASLSGEAQNMENITPGSLLQNMQAWRKALQDAEAARR